MTLEKLIEQRIDRLESVPDKLQTVIEKNELKLFKQLLNDLGKLNVENGKIVASRENLAKITGIVENLKRAFLNKDYVDAIKAFAAEIATQAQLNNSILEKTIGSFSDTEMFKAAVQNSQRNALMLLDENAITSRFLQPITEILSNATVQSVSFQEAVKTLQNNMVGENAKFSKYAKTYVKDAFSIADRQYNDLISRENEIEFYRYDGKRIKGTRYFCCVRKGKIFHRNEIASWGNKPHLWNNPNDGGKCESATGGGRNPDTNNSTIFSYLGGYGCLDVLIPIATDYVPKSVIQDAINKGYYKP